MPDKRPAKSFHLYASPDQEKIRDKDNVKPKLQPRNQPLSPPPNLAPAGMAGIKRRLPSKPHQIAASKRFTLGKKSGLSKEFKSIAPKSPVKDRSWER